MFKRTIKYIYTAGYIFLVTFLLPFLLMTAFNFRKGIQNNENGIMLIPFGFVAIGLTVFRSVVYIKEELEKHKGNCRNTLIIIAVLIIIIAAAVVLSFSSWEKFFECLFHYKGLNLGRQG